MKQTEEKYEGTVSEFIKKQCEGVDMTGAILLYLDKQGMSGIRMANMNPAKLALMHLLLGRFINKDMDAQELAAAQKTN